MIPRRVMLFSVLLLVVVVGSSGAWAQFTSGVEGTVTDPTGAVVSGATVTIKNEETGAVQTFQTQESGSFPFYHAAFFRVLHQRGCAGIQDHSAGARSAAGRRNQDSQRAHGGRWN